MMQPQGTNRFTNNRDDGSVISKEKVQEVSGFSERQLNTALRIAAIPEPEFTRQVESNNPPTLTELARQGTQKPQSPERANEKAAREQRTDRPGGEEKGEPRRSRWGFA